MSNPTPETKENCPGCKTNPRGQSSPYCVECAKPATEQKPLADSPFFAAAFKRCPNHQRQRACTRDNGHDGPCFFDVVMPRPAEPEPPKAEPCWNDTDGDGNCGFETCAHCRPQYQPKADTGTLEAFTAEQMREMAVLVGGINAHGGEDESLTRDGYLKVAAMLNYAAEQLGPKVDSGALEDRIGELLPVLDAFVDEAKRLNLPRVAMLRAAIYSNSAVLLRDALTELQRRQEDRAVMLKANAELVDLVRALRASSPDLRALVERLKFWNVTRIADDIVTRNRECDEPDGGLTCLGRASLMVDVDWSELCDACIGHALKRHADRISAELEAALRQGQENVTTPLARILRLRTGPMPPR
jgi:hypothetical protein